MCVKLALLPSHSAGASSSIKPSIHRQTVETLATHFLLSLSLKSQYILIQISFWKARPQVYLIRALRAFRWGIKRPARAKSVRDCVHPLQCLRRMRLSCISCNHLILSSILCFAFSPLLIYSSFSLLQDIYIDISKVLSISSPGEAPMAYHL